MIYAVVVYNESGEKVAVLNNTGSPTYSRSKNTADQVSFSIPRNDPDLTLTTNLTADSTEVTADSVEYTADAITFAVLGSVMQTGRRFEILRGKGFDEAILECSGFISNHGYDGEMYSVEGYTEEILLTQYLTPPQFGWPLSSENGDIGELAQELKDLYVVEQIKWAWGDYLVDSSNIDITSNPTFVILENLTPGGDATYPASGYAVFRFALGSNETWERFRWVSDYYSKDGQDVTTMVSFRQGDILGSLGAFSTPQPGAETDIRGIILPTPDALYTEVRVDFATTFDEISPVLFALEVIKRAPSGITEVDIVDDATALTTQGLSADSASFFDVLTSALEPYDWEFSVLDGRLSIAAAFGVSRTNDFSVVAG